MERDPAGLLAWLVNELQCAENAGERVWLMGRSTVTVCEGLADYRLRPYAVGHC